MADVTINDLPLVAPSDDQEMEVQQAGGGVSNKVLLGKIIPRGDSPWESLAWDDSLQEWRANSVALIDLEDATLSVGVPSSFQRTELRGDGIYFSGFGDTPSRIVQRQTGQPIDFVVSNLAEGDTLAAQVTSDGNIDMQGNAIINSNFVLPGGGGVGEFDPGTAVLSGAAGEPSALWADGGSVRATLNIDGNLRQSAGVDPVDDFDFATKRYVDDNSGGPVVEPGTQEGQILRWANAASEWRPSGIFKIVGTEAYLGGGNNEQAILRSDTTSAENSGLALIAGPDLTKAALYLRNQAGNTRAFSFQYNQEEKFAFNPTSGTDGTWLFAFTAVDNIAAMSIRTQAVGDVMTLTPVRLRFNSSQGFFLQASIGGTMVFRTSQSAENDTTAATIEANGALSINNTLTLNSDTNPVPTAPFKFDVINFASTPIFTLSNTTSDAAWIQLLAGTGQSNQGYLTVHPDGRLLLNGSADSRVVNVTDPTAPQDAATKNYVDTALGVLDARVQALENP
jgi:hypothetical protein